MTKIDLREVCDTGDRFFELAIGKIRLQLTEEEARQAWQLLTQHLEPDGPRLEPPIGRVLDIGHRDWSNPCDCALDDSTLCEVDHGTTRRYIADVVLRNKDGKMQTFDAVEGIDVGPAFLTVDGYVSNKPRTLRAYEDELFKLGELAAEQIGWNNLDSYAGFPLLCAIANKRHGTKEPE